MFCRPQISWNFGLIANVMAALQSQSPPHPKVVRTRTWGAQRHFLRPQRHLAMAWRRRRQAMETPSSWERPVTGNAIPLNFRKRNLGWGGVVTRRPEADIGWGGDFFQHVISNVMAAFPYEKQTKLDYFHQAHLEQLVCMIRFSQWGPHGERGNKHNSKTHVFCGNAPRRKCCILFLKNSIRHLIS